MYNANNGIGRSSAIANEKCPSIYFALPGFRWPRGLDKNMHSEPLRFVGKGRRFQSPQKEAKNHENFK